MKPFMEDGPQMKNSIIINDVEIHLRQPDTTDTNWIGQREVHRLLAAALLRIHENDRAMTPVLIGSPGCGKTTLACTVAQEFNQPVYIVNCTSDMRPEDLLVIPVISSDQKILYRGSSLVSAMVSGGLCVLDEANRMNEKAWASLASLLDHRRYVESGAAGVKIPAHREFRLVATMNEDSSTYNIPEYIASRLKPIIPVEVPRPDDLKAIICSQMPFIPEELVESVVHYLVEKKESGEIREYSIRDAVEITRFARKLSLKETVPVDTVARKILTIHEAKKIPLKPDNALYL